MSMIYISVLMQTSADAPTSHKFETRALCLRCKTVPPSKTKNIISGQKTQKRKQIEKRSTRWKEDVAHGKQ